MRIEVENGYIELEEGMEPGELVIEMVEAYEKRTGTGSKLVEMAKEYAKNEGKHLTLCAYPQDDSIELDELVAFYDGLGFEVEFDDGSEALMKWEA